MDIVDRQKGIVSRWSFGGKSIDEIDLERELKNTKKIVKRIPNDPRSHDALGFIYSAKGELDRSIKEFKIAIRLKPNNGEYHDHLAYSLMLKGSLDEALIPSKKAIKLEPENPAYYNTLGCIYFKYDMWDEFISCNKKIVELDPKESGYHNNLALALMYKNQFEEAILEYKEAISLDPNQYYYHNNYAIDLKELKLYDDAIFEYKEAIRLNPQNIDSYYSLGTVYSYKGDVKEAVVWYLEALKINSEYIHAQTAILKLCTEKDNRKSVDVYEYDIAISYAGENKIIAKEIADKLTANNVKVFFSDYYQELLWGENQAKIFEEIFTSKAKYCIILVSKNYVEKAWPRIELNSAMSRHMKENKGYILQVKLDDTKLPGLPDTYGYIKYESSDKVVDLILKKLK